MMKKVLLALACALLLSANAHAALKIIGKGEAMTFDPSGFSPAMKANYEIMKVKCTKCHTMQRTVLAITSGIAPTTMQPFDRNATKMYGIKMMRKPDSNMNKAEVKATVDLMNYMLDGAPP